VPEQGAAEAVRQIHTHSLKLLDRAFYVEGELTPHDNLLVVICVRIVAESVVHTEPLGRRRRGVRPFHLLMRAQKISRDLDASDSPLVGGEQEVSCTQIQQGVEENGSPRLHGIRYDPFLQSHEIGDRSRQLGPADP
jgi:hypothetical protein